MSGDSHNPGIPSQGDNPAGPVNPAATKSIPSKRERFQRIKAQLSEQFPDYVIIARDGQDGFLYSYSDSSYAQGSMDRLTRRIQRDDHPAGEDDS